ncbi:PAS domain S-box protein [Planctomycetota bacterium]
MQPIRPDGQEASNSQVPRIPQALLDKWQQLIDAIAELMDVKAVLITRSDLVELEILTVSRSQEHPFRVGDRFFAAGHYCEEVIQNKKRLLIHDAASDPRWKDTPEAQAGLLSYLGFPLLWPDGTLFGSLCLFGAQAHQIKPLHETLIANLCEVLLSQLASHWRETHEHHQAQAEFDTMFESSPDAIMFISLDGTITQCNQASLQLYGADSKCDLVGRSAFTLIPPEEQIQAQEHLAALPARGTIRHVRYNFLTRSGQTVPVEVASSVTRDSQGQATSIIVIVQDIRERLCAEEAIREQEAQLHSILRAAPIGVGLLCDRIFKHVNDQFCKITGYGREDLIEQSARLLYASQEEYERVGRDKYQQIERQGTGTVETQWQCKDGKILDILLSSTPLNHEDLSQGITFTALDITERKTYQSKLRSLAQQLAIAEERERRRVAVGVHDDIGQKLVLAKLELQSLQQTLADGPTVDSLARVCDIIDATMQEARTLAFDLSNPVLYEVGFDAAVESWLARQVKEVSGIDYTFSTNRSTFKLEEQTQVMLFQIVREILTNAIKHAQASMIDVTIIHSPNTLTVTVADNGVGFDTHILHRGAIHANGLGIFNIRERLEHLGGTMEFSSGQGQGTTVKLMIPVKMQATEDTDY